jgi:hypothetical protein
MAARPVSAPLKGKLFLGAASLLALTAISNDTNLKSLRSYHFYMETF